MKKDSLGDRIKKYESISESYFLPKTPILIRVDGKAFHTWTKGCDKPFDTKLINCMFDAAKLVAAEMQGCAALYAQSDEVTFVLLDNQSQDSQQWFGGRRNKIESVAAALMTGYFNRLWEAKTYKFTHSTSQHPPAFFDARAFQVPVDDVPNAFLWRVRDWERNSLTMFCSQFFSHKQLNGQDKTARHDMLHEIGKNWATDCNDQQKNGSWWAKGKKDRFDLTNYNDIWNYIFMNPLSYALFKSLDEKGRLSPGCPLWTDG